MAKLDKLLDGAQQHLDVGETVVQAIQGTYATKIMGKDSVRTGSLIATDRRVVFYAKKLGGYDLESFPYSNISSIETGKGLGGGKVSLFASGNDVSMKYIKAGDLEAFVAEVRGRIGKSTAAPSGGSIDELSKLVEMHNAGVLTDEEFSAAKAKALGL